MQLRISPVLLEDIARLAREAAPREACGLLVGMQNSDGIWVESLAPSLNLATADDAFEIDPALLLALQKSLRDGPLRMVGVYHSHPNGQIAPSPRDVAGASWPGFAWLICALAKAGPARHAAYWHKSDAGVPPAELPPLAMIIA